MSDKILNLTDAQLTDHLAMSELPVLVDFWAPWCGPCKSIAPILDELAEAYDGKLEIVKVNVDENPGTPAQNGVRGIPTMILFKDGAEVARKSGAVNKITLATFIDSNI